MGSSNWQGLDGYIRLASAFGPPGLGGPVRDELRRVLHAHCQALTIDRIGNLTARFGPKGPPAVMVIAHMDEVAFVVKAINSKGELGLLPQGWLAPEKLQAQDMVV